MEPVALEQIFALLVLFQMKHFVADFPLQNEWMVFGKARDGVAWLGPLGVHVLIHGTLSLFILLWLAPAFWYLCFVDAGTHLVMDRIKAWKLLLNRWKVHEAMFFNVLGFDQMVHHLTNFWMVYWIFTSGSAS